MSAMTISIRAENPLTKEQRQYDVAATTVAQHFAVHREVRGHRLIDESIVYGKVWHVTHLPSGFKAAHAPNKKAAVHAAKMLAELPVPWATLTVNDARKLKGEMRTQIDLIRGKARLGATP